ncbi:ATP-grasp domain-containing protein [Candidatus Electrothrix gigas]
MAKIHIGGAGGAPSNGFIRSLRESSRSDYFIGTSCIASDLFIADVEEKYVVPAALDAGYEKVIISLLQKNKPEFIHLQNDFEIRAVSRLRHQLDEMGICYYMPTAEVIENCVDKQKSYEIWRDKGIRTPETILLNSPEDLKKAFDLLGEKIWIRAVEGGGGRGALPTENFDFARIWIDHFNGWGEFTAAKLLAKDTVTWLSIWHEGELVVAQTRKRLSWNFGNRTLSGVTGVTGVGQTYSDSDIDRLAQDAIYAIDNRPHGIYGVDMTYGYDELAYVTEINISRFFTTHYFFTKAGLNMPEIYCNIALNNEFPSLEKKINPLPDNLLWIRGMDVNPVLVKLSDLEHMVNQQS